MKPGDLVRTYHELYCSIASGEIIKIKKGTIGLIVESKGRNTFDILISENVIVSVYEYNLEKI